MNAKLIADVENLLRTAKRLQRVGLVVDRGALSPANRRAAFALQCHLADSSAKLKFERAPIGFPYPNAR